MNHSHSNMVLLSSNFTVLIPYKTFGLCRLGDIIMSKKLLNKVISAILVLAVCSTAFLGCVVSAETYEGTYTIVGQHGAEVSDDIRAVLTIKSSVAFVAGIFTVTADEPLDFNNINTTAISGKDASGNTVTSPQVYFNAEKNKILFQGWKDSELALVEYSEISIELVFKPTENKKIVAGTKYAINVTDVDVTDKSENTYNMTLEGDAGSVHGHTYKKKSMVGDVTTYECTVDGCDAEKAEITSSKVLDSAATKAALDGVNKMSVTFTADGELVLNFLINPALAEDGNTIYLAKVEGDKITLNSYAGKIEGFDAYQNVYVGGAKTIGDAIEAVFVEVDSEYNVNYKGSTISQSIYDYCKTVIDENTNEAAVKYCRGLLSYGKEAASNFDYDAPTLEAIANTDTVKYIYTDEDLTEENLKLTSDLVNTTNYENNGWSFASVNVRAITKPVLRLAFKIKPEALATLELTINYNGVKKEFKANTFASAGNDKYYIDIDDIPTKKMREAVTVTNTTDGTTDTSSCAYSVETYAFAKSGTTVGKLCKTLIAYSDALAAAFGS